MDLDDCRKPFKKRVISVYLPKDMREPFMYFIEEENLQQSTFIQGLIREDLTRRGYLEVKE